MTYSTQREARASGAQFYTAQKPCRHGHTGPRYTSNQICVACGKASHRRQYVAQGDYLRAKARERYPRERVSRIAYATEYYRANKATVIAKTVVRNRRYRRDNPGRYSAKNREWAKANADRRAATQATREARKANAPGKGISTKEWRWILREAIGICAYCNERKPLTMDHIEPLSRGGAHDPENATAACPSCNSSKHSSPLFLWLAKRALLRNAA